MNATADPPRGAWRRFTAGFARVLDWLLIATVAVLVVPVTMQIFSRYTQMIPAVHLDRGTGALRVHLDDHAGLDDRRP